MSGLAEIIGLADKTTLIDTALMMDLALLAAEVLLNNASDVAQLDKATELAMSAARAGGVDEAHFRELTASLSQVSKRSLKDDGYDL